MIKILKYIFKQISYKKIFKNNLFILSKLKIYNFNPISKIYENYKELTLSGLPNISIKENLNLLIITKEKTL